MVGRGSVTAKPDRATIDLAVETSGDSADAAAQENRRKMDAVLDALKGAGVSEQDITTSSFSIFEETRADSAPHPTPAPHGLAAGGGGVESFGFDVPDAGASAGTTLTPAPGLAAGATRANHFRHTVANRVRVTVNNISQLGGVLAAAARAGVTSVFGPSFDLKDSKTFEREARAAAVADARQRAEELARLIGAEVGPVLRLRDESRAPGGDGGLFKWGGGGVSGTTAETRPQINPGELTFSSEVDLTYELLLSPRGTVATRVEAPPAPAAPAADGAAGQGSPATGGKPQKPSSRRPSRAKKAPPGSTGGA